MRSVAPMPGNPWPHDMVIRVKNDSNSLLELLWVREAWALHPEADDLPPFLSDTPDLADDAETGDVDREAWRREWPQVWFDVVEHAAREQDSSTFSALSATADGSPERAELLSRMIGPTWRDRLGTVAFTERHQAWRDGRFEQSPRYHRSLEEQPERKSLDALIRAWRSGLTTIVTVPCRGEYTRTIGTHALMVTDATRGDPDAYASALESFR